MAGKKYTSRHVGKTVDEAVDYVLQQKALENVEVIKSTPDDPIKLDELTEEDGKFTIYYFEGGATGAESGKPIDIEVYRDGNENVVQRYTQNNIVMERKQDAVTGEWSEWAPKGEIVCVDGNEPVSVTKDTFVFRKVDNIDNLDEILNPTVPEE